MITAWQPNTQLTARRALRSNSVLQQGGYCRAAVLRDGKTVFECAPAAASSTAVLVPCAYLSPRATPRRPPAPLPSRILTAPRA